jgi:hypothetical protein
LSSVSTASGPKSCITASGASAYASSTKSTPSSARLTARSVLSAVVPTYCPTSPALSTSTRCPRRSSPIARYISASSRAIVVLPGARIAEEDEVLRRRDLRQTVLEPARLHLKERDDARAPAP